MLTVICIFWLTIAILLFFTHAFCDVETGKKPWEISLLAEAAMCLAWPVLLPSEHLVEYFKDANK